jgi:two-component system sensor histidine kinase CpxA
MKFRFPLYAQIICVFVLNLALLVGLRYAFISNQFHTGWEYLLYSPVSDKVQGVSFDIFKQFQLRPESEWNAVLQEYGDFYDVKFYLFDAEGKQLAGEKIRVPDAVFKKLTSPPEMRIGAPGLPLAPPPGPVGPPQFVTGFPPPPPPNNEPRYEAGVKIVFAPGFLGPLDHLLGRPHPPPAPRLMIHTDNPERFWIGALFPMGWNHRVTAGSGFNPRAFLPGTLVAMTPNIWQTKLVSDYGNLFLIVLGVFALSLVLWWPFVFLITRALGKLTSATEKIADGNFDTELNIKRFDEIGRLAQAIATMSKRLKAYVNGQKRFLGDISHELCSPIARLQVALEILERTSSKDQESCINDIREEVQQMSMLINELLAFSKAGIQGRETELQSVNLNKLIDSAISRTNSNNIVTNIQPDLGCMCDELLLERALGNILRNAIRYAGDAGPISVSGLRDGDEVVVTVSDCGPGVPPESIKLLGEPFYRPEESRNRSFGGVGLGLAIVKSCIEACHGSFKVENLDPHGLKVEMRLRFAETASETRPLPAVAP